MAIKPLWSLPTTWTKEYVSDVAPGVDERLWSWHRNKEEVGCSKYAKIGTASKMVATINMGVYNAVIAYIAALGIKGDIEKVAIGKGKLLYMAEMELPDGSRQIATYNVDTQIIEAATVSSSGRYLPYDLSKASQECGMVIFLALLPELLKDEEAQTSFQTFLGKYEADDIDDVAGNSMSKLSDNIYRRIQSDIFKVKIASNVRFVSPAKIKTGAYSPDEVIGGKFLIFNNEGEETNPSSKNVTVVEAKERFKSYSVLRSWTREEQKLMEYNANRLKLKDDDIVPEEVIEMAEYIVGSSNDKQPIRNFIWRGITAIGKSFACKVLACILGVPYIGIICFPEMRKDDFMLKIVPETSIDEDSFSDVEFPSIEEMMYDSTTAYKKLTGVYNEEITPDMCMEAYEETIKRRIIKEFEKSSDGAPRFKAVMGDYVKGLTSDYVVEIQEPSLILKAGTLAGLNDYDEPGSVISLLDGRHVLRSKNAIVVYTDNVSYEGCQLMNQSATRRTFLAIDSYEMGKEDVLNRVKSMSEFYDDSLLEEMYTVWASIQKHCEENDITDGSVSIAELANWAKAVRIRGTDKLYQTCIRTVVAKATSYPDQQKLITAACVDTPLG